MPDLLPPAHDELDGVLLRLPGWINLVLLTGAKLIAYDWEIIHQGPMILCYGLSYLHYSADTLLPQWAYDDFRREYHGADALSFILQRGETFPRADVRGRRMSTGTHDQRFFKEMDIAARLRAIAYRSLDDSVALGQVDVIVWRETSGTGFMHLPEGDHRPTEWMDRAVNCYAVGNHDIERLPELLSRS